MCRKPKTLNVSELNLTLSAFPSQAATTNSKSALSASNKKTTLPADFQFPPETLSQLSLKPSSSVSLNFSCQLTGLVEEIESRDAQARTFLFVESEHQCGPLLLQTKRELELVWGH